MREEEVRRYAELMKKWDLTSLTVTDRESTISLERGGRVPAEAAPFAEQPFEKAETEAMPAREDSESVTSPMVGVFYAAPAENAEPFVSVGDHVKKGDTLCIIEAMKLMNEICAERDGTISQICAANGQVVEYGTELFRIGR